MSLVSKWDCRFMGLAEHLSTWSKDPSTKVGAVISKGNRILSVGYNGFPAGIDDSEERLLNRDWKYKATVHAEINALLAARCDVAGASIYLFPFMPCSTCCAALINAGIAHIFSRENSNPRWAESFTMSKALLEESGISLTLFPEGSR